MTHCTKKLPKPFKLGLIGGLGPAATVDLYDKIVKATPAKNDQEHFKVVIEQNPQIDDRTARLLNGGPDPTIAMYNCAKRLQKTAVIHHHSVQHRSRILAQIASPLGRPLHRYATNHAR